MTDGRQGELDLSEALSDISRDIEPRDRPPRIDRELSWLAFNARVLQEAEDPAVPLYERLRFLAIVSSNLDEFFRVRVAALRSLLRLRKKRVKHLSISPRELLAQIHESVLDQQTRFGAVLTEAITSGLEAHGVRIPVQVEDFPETHDALEELATTRLLPEITVRPLGSATHPTEGPVFLADRGIHLVASLAHPDDAPGVRPRGHALVAIPSPPLPRFVPVDLADGTRAVFFLDDVLRWKLPDLFPEHRVRGAWSVKLSRDAELGLEDEFDGDLVAAIHKSLKKREQGLPSRFLYDRDMPAGLLRFLQGRLGLEPEDLVEGGRYHNLSDLAKLPEPPRPDPSLEFPAWPPIPHPELDDTNRPILETVSEKDRLLHPPYHSFDAVVRFLDEAAHDPGTREIFLTVYRVARDSRVLKALLAAAERGVRVQVFCEVQARFDEEANLRWGERLAAAGVRTLYGSLGRKVHAKLALVRREEEDGTLRNVAFVGTGNFNEDTARFYGDLGLFTADPRIADAVHRVMRFLDDPGETFETDLDFTPLWTAPTYLRTNVLAAIAREREAARAGRPSGIDFKLNSLEDQEVVEALWDARADGVPIRGVVRGICCMGHDAEGGPPGLELRSVVDRYLEHARIYRFHNGGEDDLFIASADWMHRNLDRRLEVAVPLYDADVRAQVLWILETQLEDRPKARIIDSAGTNPYPYRYDSPPAGGVLSAQEAHRTFLLERARHAAHPLRDPAS